MSSERTFEFRFTLTAVIGQVIALLIAAAVGYLNAHQRVIEQAPMLAPAGAEATPPLFTCGPKGGFYTVTFDNHPGSIFLACEEGNP